MPRFQGSNKIKDLNESIKGTIKKNAQSICDTSKDLYRKFNDHQENIYNALIISLFLNINSTILAASEYRTRSIAEPGYAVNSIIANSGIAKRYAFSSIDTAAISKEHVQSRYSEQMTLEDNIELLSEQDTKVFQDSRFYKDIRLKEAKKQIEKYKSEIKGNIIVIDKTFQKGLIFLLKDSYKSISIDSVLKNPGLKYKELDDDTSYVIVESKKLNFIGEFDCSTAKVYGSKNHTGDGKTPEGLFFIETIEPSANKIFEGKKAYGPSFLRIFESIGVHGNGTDTTLVENWRKDAAYKAPEPLGIYNNNFGYGRSHGCIRCDNSLIRDYVRSGLLSKATPVIIYENKDLTELLSKHYKTDDSINDGLTGIAPSIASDELRQSHKEILNAIYEKTYLNRRKK